MQCSRLAQCATKCAGCLPAHCSARLRLCLPCSSRGQKLRLVAKLHGPTLTSTSLNSFGVFACAVIAPHVAGVAALTMMDMMSRPTAMAAASLMAGGRPHHRPAGECCVGPQRPVGTGAATVAGVDVSSVLCDSDPVAAGGTMGLGCTWGGRDQLDAWLCW